MLLAALCLPAVLEAHALSIRFDRISREEGLSQLTVNCILQDRVGFMWFGTQEGLNRYDGYGFEIYKHDPADPRSLPTDWISALAEDSDGNLWIGTDGGCLVRRDRSGTFRHFRHDPEDPASLSGDRVRTVLVDSHGDLWIGTFNSGLNHFTEGAFERYRHDPEDPASLSGDRMRAIYEDGLRNRWIGTDHGLSLFDRVSGSAIRLRHDASNPSSLSDDEVMSIVEDHAGNLWIGTQEGGLNRLERPTMAFIRYLYDPSDPASLSHDRVRALVVDHDRRLWVGTDGGLSLMLSQEGRFARSRHDGSDPSSVSDDRVMSIFQGRSDILWVGTQGGGLSKWNPATWAFSHYRALFPSDDGSIRQGGLSSNSVYAFSEDLEGRLWIGTFGGLDVFDRKAGDAEHFRAITEVSGSRGDDRVSALLHDRHGMLWVRTLASGLSRLRPAGNGQKPRLERFRHDPAFPDSLSHDAVAALFEDRQGRLWVGTFNGGVNRFVGESPEGDHSAAGFVHYRPDPENPASLSDHQVTAFAETDGYLWIGTFNGGLNRLQDPQAGDFLHLRHDPGRRESLSSDMVYALHLDDESALCRDPGRPPPPRPARRSDG